MSAFEDSLWTTTRPSRWLVLGVGAAESAYIRVDRIESVVGRANGTVITTTTGEKFSTSSPVADVMRNIGVQPAESAK